MYKIINYNNHLLETDVEWNRTKRKNKNVMNKIDENLWMCVYECFWPGKVNKPFHTIFSFIFFILTNNSVSGPKILGSAGDIFTICILDKKRRTHNVFVPFLQRHQRSITYWEMNSNSISFKATQVDPQLQF
jgi:hypothetical protein